MISENVELSTSKNLLYYFTSHTCIANKAIIKTLLVQISQRKASRVYRQIFIRKQYFDIFFLFKVMHSLKFH